MKLPQSTIKLMPMKLPRIKYKLGNIPIQTFLVGKEKKVIYNRFPSTKNNSKRILK